MAEIFRLSQVFGVQVIDYTPTTALLQSIQTEKQNNDLAAMFGKYFLNRIEIIRGGSVAVEALNGFER